MKILFCSHTGAFSGGAEKSMLLIIKFLIKQGHDVIVNIPDSKSDYINALKVNDITYVTILKDSNKTSFQKLSLLIKIKKVFIRLLYILKIRRFILENNFDLVYLNTLRTTSELLASKIARKKTIIHLRGFDTKSTFRYNLLRFSDKVIVLNNYAKDFISNHVSLQNVFVIPNGVGIKTLRSKNFKGKINIIHVGSYNYRKGTDFIFNTLKDLLLDEGINFYHVGKSLPEDDFSKDVIKKNRNIIQRPNFHEIGYLPNDKLIDLLDDMHIFLLPSRIEGLPRTVLEAMERGLISVISDIPEHNELIIDFKTGLKIDFSIYSEIKKIKSLILDKEHFLEMSKNSRMEAVNNYDILKINTKIYNVIKELYED
jgi:glycosyltransferase involved in cell wall biosynthesis